MTTARTEQRDPPSGAPEAPARYSSRPLPAYRHRPGQTPHPIRDQDGHSHGKETAPEAIDQDSWHTCDTYLFAIDLINTGYHWEGHEELEGLWLGAGRATPVGRFVQGIIQAAAALLKIDAGNIESATKLTTAATEKLRHPGKASLGLDGERVARELEEHLRAPRAVPFYLKLSMPG